MIVSSSLNFLNSICSISLQFIFEVQFLQNSKNLRKFQALSEKGKSIEGVRQWPYKAAARALEVIPRTLVQNCGGATVRQLTALRAKHAQATENWTWGINGCTGELVSWFG